MSNRRLLVTLAATALALNATEALAGTPPPVPPVPEPGSLLLFAVGGIAAAVAIRATRRK